VKIKISVAHHNLVQKITLDATTSCPLETGMHSTIGCIGLNVGHSNNLFCSIKRNEKLPHAYQFHFCFLTKM